MFETKTKLKGILGVLCCFAALGGSTEAAVITINTGIMELTAEEEVLKEKIHMAGRTEEKNINFTGENENIVGAMGAARKGSILNINGNASTSIGKDNGKDDDKMSAKMTYKGILREADLHIKDTAVVTAMNGGVVNIHGGNMNMDILYARNGEDKEDNPRSIINVNLSGDLIGGGEKVPFGSRQEDFLRQLGGPGYQYYAGDVIARRQADINIQANNISLYTLKGSTDSNLSIEAKKNLAIKKFFLHHDSTAKLLGEEIHIGTIGSVDGNTNIFIGNENTKNVKMEGIGLSGDAFGDGVVAKVMASEKVALHGFNTENHGSEALANTGSFFSKSKNFELKGNVTLDYGLLDAKAEETMTIDTKKIKIINNGEIKLSGKEISGSLGKIDFHGDGHRKNKEGRFELISAGKGDVKIESIYLNTNNYTSILTGLNSIDIAKDINLDTSDYNSGTHPFREVLVLSANDITLGKDRWEKNSVKNMLNAKLDITAFNTLTTKGTFFNGGEAKIRAKTIDTYLLGSDAVQEFDGGSLVGGNTDIVTEEMKVATILFAKDKGNLNIQTKHLNMSAESYQEGDGNALNSSKKEKLDSGFVWADNEGKVQLDILEGGSFTGRTMDNGKISENFSVKNGKVNMNLEKNAVWNLSGNSSITELHNKGLVDLTYDDKNTRGIAKTTLHIQTLEEGGLFKLSANEKEADLITVKNGKGNILLSLSTDEDPNWRNISFDNVLVARIEDSSNLSVDTTTIDKGNQLYIYQANLVHDGNDYRLLGKYRKKSNEINTVNALAPAKHWSALFHIWRNSTTNDRVFSRMYELREGENDGIWTNMARGKYTMDGLSGSSNELTLGWDHLIKSENAKVYAGAALYYTEGSNDSDYAKAKNENVSITAYSNLQNAKKQYLAMAINLGHWNSKYDSKGKISDHARLNTWTSNIRFEGGRKIELTDTFSLEPYAQMSYGRIWNSSSKSKNSIESQLKSVDSLVGSLGIRFRKELINGHSLYAKAAARHEFLENNLELLDGTGEKGSAKMNKKETWYEFAVGGSMKLSPSWNLYTELERIEHAKFKLPWRVQVGFNYHF